MTTKNVEILLATYNGERFIGEQIESILAQTFSDWKLIIRDDGSSDRTREICAGYVRNHPDRLELIEDGLGNLGVVGNFAQLIHRSKASYVMFCDQDDVWLPEKIESELIEIKRLEAIHGNAFPLAVFTDAIVVDMNARLIAPSLLRYINRQRKDGALNRLCVEGNCYGCTMILNRALIDRIGPIPSEVISHDWWCGMLAAAVGRLVFLDCTPIQHRRHGLNASATKESSVTRYAREWRALAQHRRWISRVLAQAVAFDRRYGNQLSLSRKQLFSDLCLLQKAHWFGRRYIVARNGIQMTGVIRNAVFLLLI